jgi:hypothetical protein
MKRKEMYVAFVDLFIRKLHRNGDISVNNIFCTILAMMCGLRIHSSFSAVLWVVPTAFELGVDRKTTQPNRTIQREVS